MVNTLEDAGDSVRFFLSIIINSDKKQQRKTARKATEIITKKKKIGTTIRPYSVSII